MIQRHIFVTGDVQGVGFRAFVRSHSKNYSGLSGFVRNLADGRVEAIISGQEADVLEMVAWCRKGPSSARVTHLEVKEEVVNFSLDPFEIQ